MANNSYEIESSEVAYLKVFAVLEMTNDVESCPLYIYVVPRRSVN